MKCIVLAAGYATRLYPLTENFPKPLLNVNGKTILDYLLDDISSNCEVEEFIVVSNHKFFDIFKKWSEESNYNIKVLDDGSISNEERLGAVKDISFAYHNTELSDSYLVIAGDNLLDFSLGEFVSFAKEKNTSCVMRYELDDINKLRKTGVLELSGDRVIGMEEKPVNPKSNCACPPFYYYLDKDIKRVDEALLDGCKYDAPGSFVSWLCKKSEVNSFLMPGNRYDIGNLESYENVKKIYKGVNYENKSRIKK